MAVNNKTNTKNLVISSMLTALIFVITYFVQFSVPIPLVKLNGAYINLGDCVIYCASMLVSAPWAAAASGIGSVFSDFILSPIYVPGTIIVKGLMGFVCSAIMRKSSKFSMFVLACITGGAIMVAGYGLYEWLCFGWAYAITTIPFNLIQWAGGVIGAVALYYPVKRIKAVI